MLRKKHHPMRPSDRSRQIPLPVSLAVEARFQTYYAGANASAIAALQDLPSPGIWLASQVGCGRSHLLQAVAASHPAGNAMYLPLTRELPAASITGFAVDAVVCLDDVHVVAGDAAWEQALFALYETLFSGGGRLLVSADDRPAQTGFVLPDLVSRFASLAFYQLQPLSDDALIDALQLRARFRGLELPDAAAAFLIKRLPREPAALFEWLRKLDLESLSAQRRLTLPFVRDTLAKLLEQ
ncbi:MAG: DnaA/Hda family protein [Pseudomonadota bacterium]